MTYVKLVYYLIFAAMYGLVGSFAEVVMVNSTWTLRHIRSLWRLSPNVQIVYPPCSLNAVMDTNQKEREPIVLSIGQFRPEKDHVLQIEAMEMVAKRIPKAKLVLAGSCRNQSDQDRLAFLKSRAGPNVEFCVNQPFSVIADFLRRSTVGVHTMWNEHFGIGIVEMMAAGLIVVAHNSGGPKADIVEPGRTGFLASTVEEYAATICQVFEMSADDREQMRIKAMESAKRFSDEAFAEAFQAVILSMKI
jgi:alpha-1,2-mannosyltransferase